MIYNITYEKLQLAQHRKRNLIDHAIEIKTAPLHFTMNIYKQTIKGNIIIQLRDLFDSSQQLRATRV